MADDQGAPLQLGGDVDDAAHVADVLIIGNDDPAVIGMTFLPRGPSRVLLSVEPAKFHSIQFTFQSISPQFGQSATFTSQSGENAAL